MTTSDQPPPIDEIVGLLASQAPDALGVLSQRYPQEKALLRPGRTMGERPGRQERLRVEVCLAGMKTAVDVCQRTQPIIDERLRGVKRLGFTGQIITAVGGASVVTTTLAKHADWAWVGGVLALAGSLVPLAVKYAGSTLNSVDSLFDKYKDLTSMSLEAEEIARELEIWIVDEEKGPYPGELVTRGNLLARRIRESVSQIGLGVA